MPIKEPLQYLETLLISKQQFLMSGDKTVKKLELQLSKGTLTRLYHGWYMQTDEWANLSSRQKHLARALCVKKSAKTREPVFSHETAALLLGLPLYQQPPFRVQILTQETSRASSSKQLARRFTSQKNVNVCDSHGMKTTTIAQTITSLIEKSSAENALVALDYSLAQIQRRQSSLDSFIAKILSIPTISPARRKIFLEIADPLSDSPLETISRLQLKRLGFSVLTQVEVASSTGWKFFVDFELEGLDILCEADGKSKYFDEAMRGGRSIESVILREKNREDWIRGVTGKRVIRWGYDDVRTPAALARKLEKFGVPLPSRFRALGI